MTSLSKSRSNLYDNINVAASSLTTTNIATASMPNAIGSVPIKSDKGVILGYAALYTAANLT